MSLFDRLQAAYYSPLGTLLLLLLLLLAAELLLYGFLWWKRGQTDLLVARYTHHFEKAAALISGLEQIGAPQADLWGRLVTVRLSNSTFGKSLVFLPELTEEDPTARFSALAHAWKDQLKAPFTALFRYSITPVWGMITEGGIRENGRPHLTLARHLADQRLSSHDKQKLLIQIAEALASLHQVQLGNGERLYHGSLLPRSLFVDLDASSVMKQFWIADTGLAYSLGPQRFYNLVQQLKRKALAMDRFLMQDWLKWLPLLAPEQTELKSLSHVGPASDFFTFGALTVWLFTEELNTDLKSIAWEKLPQNWRPFIESCLERDPAKRPKDFYELEDWNSDPELSLLAQHTLQLKGEQETVLDLPACDEKSIEELLKLLNSSSSNPQEKLLSRETKNWLEKGAQAQLKGEWKTSITYYQKALKRLPGHPEISIQLAIAYYEIGEWQKAEEFYEKTKEKDLRTARAFREHLAFRL